MLSGPHRHFLPARSLAWGGAVMPANMPLIRLIVEKGARRRQVLFIREPTATLGRGHGCAIRIPAADISRQHCRFHFDRGLLSVEDLDSANGTYVNGVLVEGRQAVASGDRIEIGPVTLRVLYQMPGEPPAPGKRDQGRAEEEEVLDALEVVDEPDGGPDSAESSRPPASRGSFEQTRVLQDMDSLRLPSPEELRRILEEMDREKEND